MFFLQKTPARDLPGSSHKPLCHIYEIALKKSLEKMQGGWFMGVEFEECKACSLPPSFFNHLSRYLSFEQLKLSSRVVPMHQNSHIGFTAWCNKLPPFILSYHFDGSASQTSQCQEEKRTCS
jgi:hypothetical protein